MTTQSGLHVVPGDGRGGFLVRRAQRRYGGPILDSDAALAGRNDRLAQRFVFEGSWLIGATGHGAKAGDDRRSMACSPRRKLAFDLW